jgi:hypothetical protein
LTLSDFFLAALTIARAFVGEAPRFADAGCARPATRAFGAAATLRLAVVLAGAATRLALARSALTLAADARLETFAPLAVLAAAFLTGRASFGFLAEIFVSLLLATALDFDGRLVALEERLGDFFGAFLRVDMADLLLKSSASGMRQFTALAARSLAARSLVIQIAANPIGRPDRAD